MRTLPKVLLLCLLACLSACNGTSSTFSGVPASWVAAWGAVPENATSTTVNPGGQDQTFRTYFYPTTSGTMERVHLSNYYGTAPLTIGAARLALAGPTGGNTAGSVDPNNNVALTFNGSSSVVIPAGGSVVSDPVQLTYTFGHGKMAVSVYCKGTFPPLTIHSSEVIINWASLGGVGDQTADTTGAALPNGTTDDFVVTGMDFYGQYQGSVVLFGSSPFDGHASNYANTNAYPVANPAVPGQDDDTPADYLARAMVAAGYSGGVINAAILGDPAGAVSGTAADVAGVNREARDVLATPGIRTMIVYLGSIDIRGTSCSSAPEVEAALTNIVAQATAVGVRTIITTLPPSAYCSTAGTDNYGATPTTAAPFGGDINPGPENPGSAQRNLVNVWIRTVGPTLPGVVGIADFDKVLLDPAHPDFMIPNLNSGDNFHPNGAGYGIMMAAVPVNSIFAAQ